MATGITKLANGKYLMRWSANGEDGKRVSEAATEQEAVKERKQLLQQIKDGKYVAPTKLTVGAYLDEWLAGRMDIKGSTREKYSNNIKAHIKPAFGDRLLSALGHREIKGLYGAMLAKGYQPGTIRGVDIVLRSALGKAVRQELLAMNPMQKLERDDRPTCEPADRVVLTVEQTRALLDQVRGTSLHMPVVLAAGTGLRRGEILGLRWADIDWERRTLQVARQISLVEGKCIVDTPKTRCATKRLHLAAATLEELAAAMKRQRGTTDDYIVTSIRNPQSLSKQFKVKLKEWGFPPARLHDLRHGHATHLHEAGADLLEIADRLRHNTIQTTATVYTHFSEERRIGTAERVEALYGSTVVNSAPTPP